MIIVIDLLMGYFISKPIAKLNQTARKMAKLDFSTPCTMTTNDEFGELAVSLHTMADNLQQALAKLEAANLRLERDVEQERRLLTERKRQRYSEIILTETERMSGLITTLLDLSALETGASRLVPERFDFVEFLETAAGRRLIDVPDGILKLSLTEQAGMLHFSIYNQDPPIPQENLPKLWPKFYRDHNSKYSGSGLGLAIVAQILSMQNLDFGVKNSSGGVEFYFSIPKFHTNFTPASH